MANPNGAIENLKPMTERTEEEQKKIATMGGIASGIVRKQKATFTNAIKWLANSNIEIKDGSIKETFKKNGIDITGLNPTQLATIGLWAGAVYGKADNYRLLAELNGEFFENLDEAPTPSLDIKIKDNSHLEKTLYEENKH